MRLAHFHYSIPLIFCPKLNVYIKEKTSCVILMCLCVMSLWLTKFFPHSVPARFQSLKPHEVVYFTFYHTSKVSAYSGFYQIICPTFFWTNSSTPFCKGHPQLRNKLFRISKSAQLFVFANAKFNITLFNGKYFLSKSYPKSLHNQLC